MNQRKPPCQTKIDNDKTILFLQIVLFGRKCDGTFSLFRLNSIVSRGWRKKMAHSSINRSVYKPFFFCVCREKERERREARKKRAGGRHCRWQQCLTPSHHSIWSAKTAENKQCALSSEKFTFLTNGARASASGLKLYVSMGCTGSSTQYEWHAALVIILFVFSLLVKWIPDTHCIIPLATNT